MAKSPRICFVVHKAFGVLAGKPTGHIGGVERQTTLMARWLAARGHSVCMVTWDEGQEDGVLVDGVRVFKVCAREAGVPGLRFLHPRWTSLNRALARADADLYYHNCAEYMAGQVALWCKARRRKFVFSVACDTDCDPRLPTLKKLRERILFRYAMTHADRLIAQTEHQRDMLDRWLHVDAPVLPMPCPGQSDNEYVPPSPPSGTDRPIIWVGRLSPQKRPDRLINVAERCPQHRFHIIGPIGDDKYNRDVRRRGESLPNVTFLGPVAHDKIGQHYREASLMCCTPDYEGFPNTYLEAWSYGLPIVSTFDPDGLIARKTLGVAATDEDSLISGINRVLGDSELWRTISDNARDHFVRNYAVDVSIARFERVFLEVCGIAPPGRSEERESLSASVPVTANPKQETTV